MSRKPWKHQVLAPIILLLSLAFCSPCSRLLGRDGHRSADPSETESDSWVPDLSFGTDPMGWANHKLQWGMVDSICSIYLYTHTYIYDHICIYIYISISMCAVPQLWLLDYRWSQQWFAINMYQRNSLTMAQGSAELAQVGLGLFVPYQMGRAKVIPGDSWDSEFPCFIMFYSGVGKCPN